MLAPNLLPPVRDPPPARSSRRADPRPRRPALAANRGISHPLRTPWRRENPHRPSPRPPRDPPRRRGPIHQNQPHSRRPRRRPRRPHLATPSRRTRPPRRALLDDFAMRELTPAASRRPLRTHQRTQPPRPQPDHHLEPKSCRLVPAIPEPRRRRIAARPAHQQQPPGLHERTQLSTQQTTRRQQQRRQNTTCKTSTETHAPRNYVSVDPGNYVSARDCKTNGVSPDQGVAPDDGNSSVRRAR